jgi:hypothetical protein
MDLETNTPVNSVSLSQESDSRDKLPQEFPHAVLRHRPQNL